jgi:phosphate transport system protein
MLPEKLTELKKDLTEYGGLIEKMVQNGMDGLIRKDKKMLNDILEVYEPLANAREIEIDEKCTSLIAQFQPMAKDLRTVLMILGMNRDLERMGDHTVNIAQSALYLIERPAVKPLINLPRMGNIVNEMLRDSINAFVNEDPVLGKKVCTRDDEVDNLKAQITRELINYMSTDAGTIERALHLQRIVGNLERIADLTTNIGEDVIFMVEGKVIKHHLED